MSIPREYRGQGVGTTGYRVLGLDLDGVCADYTAGFRRWCVERLGLDPSAFPDPAVYDLAEAGWPFTSTAEYLQLHSQAVSDGLYARLPAMPGVSEALWRLSDSDVHIRIVSHRLFLGGQHRRVVTDTAEWLDAHRIPYMSLCFSGLKDSIDATVHIDDAPATIEQLRLAGATAMVFDQPYNRDVPGPRIADWPTGVAAILHALQHHDGSPSGSAPVQTR